MNFKGKNVFITGIGGFVGTALAQNLLDEGAHVIGLVKDYNRKTNKSVLEKCSIVDGDIRDLGVVKYALSHYEVDYIVHLASQAIVSICNQDPYTAYITNVVGMLNVLEACRTLATAKKPKIVVSTSDKYYGSTNKLPYVEDVSPEVADSYCTSKTCQDMIARSYSLTYCVPVVVMRAGNIYGPGDLNMSRLVPKNSIKLWQGDSPVLYSHAADFVREFLYIDDVVSALKILMKKGVPGEAYNVGGSGPKKIGDVLELLRDTINPDIPIITKEIEFSELSVQYLDASKLMLLGWSPKVSLPEGLKKSAEYYKDLVDAKKVAL